MHMCARVRASVHRDIRTGNMPSAEAIHGSLLALGELLQHTGEFLLARCAHIHIWGS